MKTLAKARNQAWKVKINVARTIVIPQIAATLLALSANGQGVFQNLDFEACHRSNQNVPPAVESKCTTRTGLI
jgi:hypothetical protein